ncbi:MAG: nitroreductase family protein [Clostridiales bacterium]|nr:nitroreductase family protein [Clostridiales bacterium]
MEFKEILLKRRSVRKYTDEAVSDAHVDELMHAAMSGPSACNRQPWAFYVVRNEEKIAQLRKATHFSNIKAPLAIVVCGNLSKALPMQLAEYWIQDCSAATENILLRAVDLGLGTVWCGLHPQKGGVKKVSEILELDAKKIPLNIIWVGHPAEEPKPGDWYDEKRVHHIL